MLPPPPLRFSMMTGWPHFACNLSPTIRASTSLVPPPGYGMRNFTGLVGYPFCRNALLDPGGGTIDRMKMKAKAANHRTMGISVVRDPRIQVTRMPRPHQTRSRAKGRYTRGAGGGRGTGNSHSQRVGHANRRISRARRHTRTVWLPMSAD